MQASCFGWDLYMAISSSLATSFTTLFSLALVAQRMEVGGKSIKTRQKLMVSQ
jgi:hypothetical protein